jgi:hypothetical protein
MWVGADKASLLWTLSHQRSMTFYASSAVSATAMGCIVIRAPSQKDVVDNVYRVGSGDAAACYRYTPNVVPCKRDTKPAADSK